MRISTGFTHFTIDRLAEGIFAAIHQPGGAAFSNAGILDLGRQVLLFDTFETLSAGKELRRACLELTGRAPTWVVNSHKHGDHWGGNQVFAQEAILLSTAGTRSGILAQAAELEKLHADPQALEKQVQEQQTRLDRTTDPEERAALESRLVRDRTRLSDLSEFRICPPALTFTSRLTVHGGRYTAELHSLGPAHTSEDCILLIPEAGIVFTGDVAFFARPAFMAADCSPQEWAQRLADLGTAPYPTVVPGHGPVGSRADLDLARRYILAVEEMVAGAIRDGRTLDETLKLPLPEGFDFLLLGRARHEANLRNRFSAMVARSGG